MRAFPLAFMLCWCAISKGVVDKHYSVSYEAVIINVCEWADEAVALDSTMATYGHIALDFDKWTDEDIITKGAFIEIHRLDHAEILAVRDVADTRVLDG